MYDKTADPADRPRPPDDALLGLLQALDPSECPGGDGLTVEDALALCTRAAAQVQAGHDVHPLGPEA